MAFPKVWATGDQVLATDINADFNKVGPARFKSLTMGENMTAGNAACLQILPTANILYDNKNTGQTTATSKTQAFAVAANSNRMLVCFVGLGGGASPSVSSVTYNGVAMTQVDSDVNTFSNPGYFGTYYLIAPATGTNNLVITCNVSTSIDWAVFSYYNVAQTAPESHGLTGVGGSGAAINFSLAPLTNGGLVVGAVSHFTPGGTILTNNTQFNASLLDSGDSGVLYPQSKQTLTTASGTFRVAAAFGLGPITAGGSARVYKTKADIQARVDNFIGFIETSAAISAVSDINLSGYDANQSGLSIGAPQYLSDTAGAIAATPGTISKKIGMALSATEVTIEK